MSPPPPMLSLVLLLLLFTRGLLLKLILTLLFFVGLFSFFCVCSTAQRRKKNGKQGLFVYLEVVFFFSVFFFLVKLWRSSQLNSWCLSSCFLSAMPPVTICSDSALRFLSLRSSFGFLSAARLFQNSFFFFVCALCFSLLA